MYLIDYHTHTELSPDSSALLMDNAQAAVEAGLSELCVTDHYDLLSGHGQPQPLAMLRWSERLAQFQSVQAAMGDRLTLRLGVEFGSGQMDSAVAHQVLQSPGLDFVIGSLHNSAAAFGRTDYYYLEYTSLEQCYRVMDGYFDTLEELVEADCYDVLGHLIFLKRYMSCRDGWPISFEGYTERIRTVLKGAIAHGRGMELNTWCGRTLEDWRPTLAIFQELGGEFITVSSDAHISADIGKGIREGYALLKDMGFRYVTTYEGRKPTQIKL